MAQLDKICSQETIIASNTSRLNIDEMALCTNRPEKVLGLHFFQSGQCHAIAGSRSRGQNLKKHIGNRPGCCKKDKKKIAVVVGVCHGFAGNRMLAARVREIDRILLEGASIGQIDTVIYGFGFPMGHFVMGDMVGLDLGWNKESSSSSTIKEILCEKRTVWIEIRSRIFTNTRKAAACRYLTRKWKP